MKENSFFQVAKSVNLSQLMATFPNWITFSDTEKCAWLNDMIVQLWPYAKVLV